MTDQEEGQGLVFPPTLREVMLRPRWLAMLGFCLIVAAVFAWLGQWQFARAVDFDQPADGATEQVVPLADVAQPAQYVSEELIGQRVDVSGTWDSDDFRVVGSRYNDEVEGFWVTGRLELDDASSLAVAIGFTEERAEAEAAVESFAGAVDPDAAVDLTGRIISDEGPVLPSGDDPYEMTRMSPAALLGQWGEVPGETYRVYLTAHDPAGGIGDAGLGAISSPAPEIASPVNWLNVFYAVEWAIFAGCAFYLWYRLAKDAQQREIEDLEGFDPDEA